MHYSKSNEGIDPCENPLAKAVQYVAKWSSRCCIFCVEFDEMQRLEAGNHTFKIAN